jgi:hypothetical protein
MRQNDAHPNPDRYLPHCVLEYIHKGQRSGYLTFNERVERIGLSFTEPGLPKNDVSITSFTY